MANFTIITDSACDISHDILASWGVKAVSLTYHFEGETGEYTDSDIPAPEFYNAMRAGKIARTSAANAETFKALMRQEFEQGHDVLYLGFSSALSATCASGQMAINELEEEFPGRRGIAVDSLAASAGFGLLVKLVADRRDQGADLDETADYARSMIPKMAHWFTVDDLKYLKRGGRVSAASAFAGTVLNIKPVMHVDDEGRLVPVAKVRGRKSALTTMADKYGELAETPGKGPVYISHGDCIDDVNALGDMLRERFGLESFDIVTYVGPVIGSHSGPGTLALFFVAKNK